MYGYVFCFVFARVLNDAILLYNVNNWRDTDSICKHGRHVFETTCAACSHKQWPPWCQCCYPVDLIEINRRDCGKPVSFSSIINSANHELGIPITDAISMHSAIIIKVNSPSRSYLDAFWNGALQILIAVGTAPPPIFCQPPKIQTLWYPPQKIIIKIARYFLPPNPQTLLMTLILTNYTKLQL